MMGRASRDKGLDGEREVAVIFSEAGYDVRNLEGQGDALAVSGSGLLWHVETKRQERLRPHEWTRQAQDEAPRGAVPVVCYRQNHRKWFAILPLADLVRLTQ